MRIKGFEKLTDLISFTLIKREGSHTSCRFAFRTVPENALPLLSQEGGAVTVQRDDGSTLFYGLIRKVAVEQSHHGATLFVEAASYSVLADEEFHTRIFQKPVQTLQDILPKLDWSKSECELNLGDAGNQKPSGLILADTETNAVIQNDETDFAFLRRLTARPNFRLWIVDTNSGRTELRIAKHLAERQVSAKDIINIVQSRSHRQNNLCLRTSEKAELDTGQLVKIEGVPNKFIVMSKIVKKEHETFNFDYELAEEKSTVKVAEIPKRAQIFAVEIADNNDPKCLGRVQVKFIDDGVEDKGAQPDVIWIPYRTPYGGTDGKGGIVFLPDKGDKAEVLLLGRRLWAADSFRKSALLEKCSDVAEKYIGNNNQQCVIWKKKSLEMTSFKNRIVLDENKIELTVGDSQTRLFMDKDKILLQTKGNAVELSAQGIKFKSQKNIAADADADIHVTAKQNLRTESNKDGSFKVTGKMTLKADDKITIDGSKVNIC